MNEGAHEAEGESPAAMTPGRVAFHARSMIGDERTCVVHIPVRLHGRQRIEVAFIDEDLGVVRYLPLDEAEVNEEDLAQPTEVADLLEHIDPHLGNGALAEGDAAVRTRDFT